MAKSSADLLFFVDTTYFEDLYRLFIDAARRAKAEKDGSEQSWNSRLD